MTNLKDSALITFRVTPEEKKALKVAAAACDMSIRELLHAALMMKLTSLEIPELANETLLHS